MLELIGNILILAGSIFCFIAVLGTIKLSTIFAKMHAATKTATLGCGLILLGTGIQMDNSHGLTEVILLIFFIALTNPISAHLIANLVYTSKA